jgi:hypothetical protein
MAAAVMAMCSPRLAILVLFFLSVSEGLVRHVIVNEGDNSISTTARFRRMSGQYSDLMRFPNVQNTITGLATVESIPRGTSQTMDSIAQYQRYHPRHLGVLTSLRGGNSEATSAPTQSRFGKIVSTIKTAIWSFLVCFMGLTVVSLTMFLYFVIIVYFLEALQATSGKELSPNTIAAFSLIGSVLGSFAGGVFLGRIAPSHPSRFAAVVGVTFMILQLNQLALFQGIPAWFTILSIVSYPPCCVYAAKRTAQRRKPTVEPSAAANAAPNVAAAAPAGAAEPAPPLTADGEAAAASSPAGAAEPAVDGEAAAAQATVASGVEGDARSTGSGEAGAGGAAPQ